MYGESSPPKIAESCPSVGPAFKISHKKHSAKQLKTSLKACLQAADKELKIMVNKFLEEQFQNWELAIGILKTQPNSFGISTSDIDAFVKEVSSTFQAKRSIDPIDALSKHYGVLTANPPSPHSILYFLRNERKINEVHALPHGPLTLQEENFKDALSKASSANPLIIDARSAEKGPCPPMMPPTGYVVRILTDVSKKFFTTATFLSIFKVMERETIQQLKFKEKAFWESAALQSPELVAKIRQVYEDPSIYTPTLSAIERKLAGFITEASRTKMVSGMLLSAIEMNCAWMMNINALIEHSWKLAVEGNVVIIPIYLLDFSAWTMLALSKRPDGYQALFCHRFANKDVVAVRNNQVKFSNEIKLVHTILPGHLPDADATIYFTSIDADDSKSNVRSISQIAAIMSTELLKEGSTYDAITRIKSLLIGGSEVALHASSPPTFEVCISKGKPLRSMTLMNKPSDLITYTSAQTPPKSKVASQQAAEKLPLVPQEQLEDFVSFLKYQFLHNYLSDHLNLQLHLEINVGLQTKKKVGCVISIFNGRQRDGGDNIHVLLINGQKLHAQNALSLTQAEAIRYVSKFMFDGAYQLINRCYLEAKFPDSDLSSATAEPASYRTSSSTSSPLQASSSEEEPTSDSSIKAGTLESILEAELAKYSSLPQSFSSSSCRAAKWKSPLTSSPNAKSLHAKESKNNMEAVVAQIIKNMSINSKNTQHSQNVDSASSSNSDSDPEQFTELLRKAFAKDMGCHTKSEGTYTSDVLLKFKSSSSPSAVELEQRYKLLFGKFCEVLSQYQQLQQASTKSLWYDIDQVQNPLSTFAQSDASHQTHLAHPTLTGADVGPALFATSLDLISNAIFAAIQETHPIVMLPVNLNYNHWVSVILFMHGDTLHVLHNDPFGAKMDIELQQNIEIITKSIITTPGAYSIQNYQSHDYQIHQQNNMYNCGPFAVENMHIIAMLIAQTHAIPTNEIVTLHLGQIATQLNAMDPTYISNTHSHNGFLHDLTPPVSSHVIAPAIANQEPHPDHGTSLPSASSAVSITPPVMPTAFSSASSSTTLGPSIAGATTFPGSALGL